MPDSSPAVTGLSHVGLSVRDIDRTIDFYRSAMPLEVVPAPGFDRAEATILASQNAFVELTAVADPTIEIEPVPVAGPGVTHICFQSPEQDQLFSQLLRAGASPVSTGDAPIDLNGAGVRYGYARDHDGLMFEVEQLEAPKFDGSFWLAHVALASPDIDRLVDFYTRLLGVEPYARVNKVTGPRVDAVTGLDGARMRAAWFNVGNMILELWQFLTPATPEPEARDRDLPGYNRFVFEVADIETALARLRRLGIAVDAEPTQVGDGHYAYGQDPDRNVFGLVQLPPESAVSLRRLSRIDWM